jgi:diguanylate cyclase (GGDEF)-like protein
MNIIKYIFTKTQIPEELREYCDSEKNKLNQTMFGFLAPITICGTAIITIIYTYLMFNSGFEIMHSLYVLLDVVYIVFLFFCYSVLKIHKPQHEERFKVVIIIVFLVTMLWGMGLSALDGNVTTYLMTLLLFSIAFLLRVKTVAIILSIMLALLLALFSFLELGDTLLTSNYLNIFFGNIIAFFMSRIGYNINVRNFMNTKIIEKQNSELKELVEIDALTGIYNRRFFDQSLERVIKTLSRLNGLLSVMMIDIDFFKKYNDTYGHDEGDTCLKLVANALAGSVCRADDFAARYGGEEFVIVMPNTGEAGAKIVAEKLMKNIEELNIVHEGNDAASFVTVSIGITSGNASIDSDRFNYIRKADQMLYESKRNGRNKYTFEYLTDTSEDEELGT